MDRISGFSFSPQSVTDQAHLQPTERFVCGAPKYVFTLNETLYIRFIFVFANMNMTPNTASTQSAPYSSSSE